MTLFGGILVFCYFAFGTVVAEAASRYKWAWAIFWPVLAAIHIVREFLGKNHNMSKEKLSFSAAHDAVLSGHKIAREGWNGKGMFLYDVPAASYSAMTPIAKETWGENSMVPYGAYIAIKGADGIVYPWTPSQADMHANDWYILD